MNSELLPELEAQIARLREAAGVKTDTALAEVLGITQGGISSAKKRGQVPANWFVKISNAFGFYLEWLTSGTGPMKGKTATGMVEHYVKPIDPDQLALVATAAETRIAALEAQIATLTAENRGLLKDLKTSQDETLKAYKLTIEALQADKRGAGDIDSLVYASGAPMATRTTK